MAGDWIKMRVWLCRDPKVIRMADVLASDRDFMAWLSDPVQRTCDDSAYEHVTRNVTVALCVTGLCVTWGTAREQGDRVDDDLVLSHCDISTIDGITDIPGFGLAMQSVGWAMENTQGQLIFPKFFRDNESPDERHKRQNANRQARYRDKHSENSNVTSNAVSNVTVTHREEKSREEKSIKGVNPLKPPAVAVAIPEELQTVEFDKAWSEWLAYRRERKHKTTERTQRGMLDRLADWGSAIAVQAINDSICNGWQGLFDPRERIRGSPSQHGSQSRHSPNDIIEDF